MTMNSKGYEKLVQAQDAAFQILLDKLKNLSLEDQLAILKSKDDPIMNAFREAEKKAHDYYELWNKEVKK